MPGQIEAVQFAANGAGCKVIRADPHEQRVDCEAIWRKQDRAQRTVSSVHPVVFGQPDADSNVSSPCCALVEFHNQIGMIIHFFLCRWCLANGITPIVFDVGVLMSVNVFDEAIRVHARWKLFLAEYANNSVGRVDAQVIGNAGCCALGQWIVSGAGNYGSCPVFAELVASHAQFHSCAALIVEKINSRIYVPRSEVLDRNSRFSQASHSLLSSLAKMKRQYGAKIG